MAILNISGTINASFSTSGVLVNAAQNPGDATFTIDLRPTNPIIIVKDNLDYGAMGWDINDVAAIITLTGPEGQIYKNEDYGAPDIVPATSRYLNKTITLPLDPLTDYANILKGNYTLKVSWYNSVLDDYYNFLDTYQYNFDLPTIANTTTSGPYTGILTSTDTTEYGANVYQIAREHRIQYPTQLLPPIDDIVSSNAEVQVTPIYTNNWTIIITSFVEYRNPDTLRIYWEGDGTFIHCVYGGCIGAMADAIETMLDTYREAMACNLNNQEAYQKRLVIVNTAWHLLNEAYVAGDVTEADEQSYVIQEQVEYSGGGICGGATSTEVVPCPPWTGGGIGGTYTFSNALVEAAGNVTWGGSLVQATTILQGGHEVLFSGSDAGNTVSQSISAAGGILQKASDGSTEGRVYVTDSLITLERADLGTPANTRGYEITATGLIEKGDYKTGYVDRQLVAKDYVDIAIAAISSNTFENALTAAGGVVKFGGPLTAATEIDGGGYDLEFKADDGVDNSSHILIQNNNIKISAYNTVDWTPGNGYGCVQVTPNYVDLIFRTTGASNLFKSITMSDDYFRVRDTVDNKGLENEADYSSNWTDHSLVTKKWVVDNFVGITGSGTFVALTDTPSSFAGFGGYFLVVNSGATAVEFVASAFVPATGGTFTGQVTIATSTDRPLIIQQIGAGSTPGTPEGGTNLIAFQDNDGDEQGYIGIDASGNVVMKSWVTGAGILVDSDLEVNGDLIITGVVDGVDIAAWKTSYDLKEPDWDTAYGWGDHAGLYQPLDADLTSIAALGFASVSFLKKTAADTWALDTNVYATEAYVDALAEVTTYIANSINIVVSDGSTGTVTDVQTLNDSNVLRIEEVGGSLGYDVRFTFTSVTSFNNLFLYLSYSGGLNHLTQVQIYNPNTTLWETVSTYTDMDSFKIIDVSIVEDAKYINGSDEVQVRIYHVDDGDATHFVEVDYISLREFVNIKGHRPITDHAQLSGLKEDDHPHYALADGSRCTYLMPLDTKASSTDAGQLGETAFDNDYIYVCVSAGGAGAATWKRTPLTFT